MAMRARRRVALVRIAAHWAQRATLGLSVWLASNAGGKAQPTSERAPSGAAPSADEGGFQSLFEDEGSGAQPAPAALREPSAWSLSGALRSESALWSSRVHAQRLAKQRAVVDLSLAYRASLALDTYRGHLQLVMRGHAEYDAAYLQQRESIDAPLREAYQWLVLAREAYVGVQLGALDLRVGRQIVNWGQGEVLGLLNVLNPRDLREPVATDVGDLWLGVAMTNLAISLGSHRVDLVVVHEANFGLLPPPLAPLSPLRDLLLVNRGFAEAIEDKELRYRHVPGYGFLDAHATQYHGRWSFSGHRIDVSLQAGSLLDGLGVAGLPEPAAFGQQRLGLPVHHPRYTMIGHAAAVPLGPMLLRWEVSADLNRPMTVRRIENPHLELAAERHHQLNGLIGLTYFGAGSNGAALEVARSYVFDEPGRRTGNAVVSLWPVEALQVALRADYRFLRERVGIRLLAISFLVPGLIGLAARATLDVSLWGSLVVSVGYLYYRGSERFSPFFGFDDNHRALATLRWDFALL